MFAPHSTHGCSSNWTANVPSAAGLFQVLWDGLTCALAILASAWCPAAGWAGDWPQLLGSGRDGQIDAVTQLDKPWPPALPIAWRVPLGQGFSGAAVVGETVVAFHRQGEREILSGHRLQDGVELWSCGWQATYVGRIDPDEGPRCVPLFHAGRWYAYGAAGDLACVSATGQLLWSRALRKELTADDGYFGAGSTPVMAGETLVICVGGKQASVVGIDPQDGSTQWTCGTDEASYASPIALTTSDGATRVLAVMRLQALLIDPVAGEVLDQVRFGSRGPTVNAATPIEIAKDEYLLTASYGVGMVVVQIVNDNQLREVARDQTLASQYNTPVVAGEKILGIDGREDVGVASLKILDRKTRKALWEQPGFGTAHLLAAGSRVLSLNKEGLLMLVDATTIDDSGYRELSRGQLPAGTYRALPALVGQRLIVRRSASKRDSELICIELP